MANRLKEPVLPTIGVGPDPDSLNRKSALLPSTLRKSCVYHRQRRHRSWILGEERDTKNAVIYATFLLSGMMFLSHDCLPLLSEEKTILGARFLVSLSSQKMFVRSSPKKKKFSFSLLAQIVFLVGKNNKKTSLFCKKQSLENYSTPSQNSSVTNQLRKTWPSQDIHGFTI